LLFRLPGKEERLKNASINSYEKAHFGKYCCGKTLMRTLTYSIPLSRYFRLMSAGKLIWVRFLFCGNSTIDFSAQKKHAA